MKYRINLDFNEDFITYLLDNLPIGLIKVLHEKYKLEKQELEAITLIDGVVNTHKNAPNLKPISEKEIKELEKLIKNIHFGDKDK